MSPELELKLVQQYPTMFVDYHGDPRATCMAWGIDHGDGWYNILDRLCVVIAWHQGDHGGTPCGCQPFVFAQIKEKFGELRIYSNEDCEFVHGAIEMATAMSSVTCETCGRPGKSNDGSWLWVRCSEHWEGGDPSEET